MFGVRIIVTNDVKNRSWAERLGRYTLGTAECVECGHVQAHMIPGPYRPYIPISSRKCGASEHAEDVSLTTHYCEQCRGRLCCGYSCDPSKRG